MINGELLQQKIKERGYSVDEFSQKVGVDRSVAYRWISGKCVFSIDRAKAIVKELKLNSDEAYTIFFVD